MKMEDLIRKNRNLTKTAIRSELRKNNTRKDKNLYGVGDGGSFEAGQSPSNSSATVDPTGD